MSTRQKPTSIRVRRFGARLLHGVRAAVLGAIAAEQDRAEKASIAEDEMDLFDRLPDPLHHLDIGDLKYFDGKFRYF